VISKYTWLVKCMVFITLFRIATRTFASLTYTSPPFNTTYGTNAGSSPTVSSWARPVLLSWQRTSVLDLYASLVHEAVSMIRTTFISQKCLLIRLWTSMMFEKVSDNKFSRHLFIHPYSFGLTQPPVQWVMKSLSPRVRGSRVCSWLNLQLVPGEECVELPLPRMTLYRCDWAQG
jgi:hypothetical protein